MEQETILRLKILNVIESSKTLPSIEAIDDLFNSIRKHRAIPFNLQSKWHSPFDNL